MADNIISMKPVRQNVKTVDSAEFMGKGSWIKVRSLSVGENNRLISHMNETQRLAQVEPVDEARMAELEQEMRVILCGALLAWNWVDSEGEDLPAPHNNPAVMDELTQQELGFVMDTIRGIERQKKVSGKKTSRS